MPYKPRCVNELYIRTPYSFSLRSRARSKNLIKRRNFLFLFPFKGERQKAKTNLCHNEIAVFSIHIEFRSHKIYLQKRLSFVWNKFSSSCFKYRDLKKNCSQFTCLVNLAKKSRHIAFINLLFSLYTAIVQKQQVLSGLFLSESFNLCLSF